MRFQNWDVLVFPANDATPIQEFTTEFCNIPDPDHAFLNKMTVEESPASGKKDSKILPTVSTYIPMLNPGTPFQISIHSWTTPEVSSTVEQGSQAMIEARVFIDGVPITYVVCPATSGWPMVVDSYPVNSAYGTRKRNLSFPAFNQDSLNQWANGDTELGRIKIVVSEGVAGSAIENGEVSYMRLKNLVCFYYRYAPQEFLESVGIYYPSTRKYDNSLARWFPISVPTHHLGGSAFGSPAHSHSPTRKPMTTGVIPPAFDLDSAIPSLGKSAYPDLQPVQMARTASDPFSAAKAGDETMMAFSTPTMTMNMSSEECKIPTEVQETSTTTGQATSAMNMGQTSGTCTPILGPSLTAMNRTDSIASMKSELSSFKLEPSEKIMGKAEMMDPSMRKQRMDMMDQPMLGKQKMDMIDPSMPKQRMDMMDQPMLGKQKMDMIDPSMSKQNMDMVGQSMSKQKMDMMEQSMLKQNMDMMDPSMSQSKETMMDPLMLKSMKISTSSESQNQMQSSTMALAGAMGEELGMKEISIGGKADSLRSNPPLVELDNIL
ncbi:hypothetical protein DFH27DRAFT_101855 [Peziza echinospora]|nr:hypothetical protein DFH27DRAFT_101855 [Peziza echinospora]